MDVETIDPEEITDVAFTPEQEAEVQRRVKEAQGEVLAVLSSPKPTPPEPEKIDIPDPHDVTEFKPSDGYDFDPANLKHVSELDRFKAQKVSDYQQAVSRKANNEYGRALASGKDYFGDEFDADAEERFSEMWKGMSAEQRSGLNAATVGGMLEFAVNKSLADKAREARQKPRGANPPLSEQTRGNPNGGKPPAPAKGSVPENLRDEFESAKMGDPTLTEQEFMKLNGRSAYEPGALS